MSLNPITLQAGKSNIPLYEFPIEGETVDYLYNPDGVIINYGYDSNGHYRVAYGALSSSSLNSAFAFEGKKYSAGLHNINLSRPLTAGEEVKLTWHDGHQLVIYTENGYTEVTPSNNPQSEGLYELKLTEETFDGVTYPYYIYKLTSDTQTIQGKKYYRYGLINKVKKRSGGSCSEIGKKIGELENTALLFNDDMNTKRFDKIEVETFEEF